MGTVVLELQVYLVQRPVDARLHHFNDIILHPRQHYLRLVTNGGRVFGVTAKGKDLKEARANAYAAAEWVQALYSSTFGPSAVSISPKKITPLKGRPSAFIASTVA